MGAVFGDVVACVLDVTNGPSGDVFSNSQDVLPNITYSVDAMGGDGYCWGEGMNEKERNEEGLHQASVEDMGQSLRPHQDWQDASGI